MPNCGELDRLLLGQLGRRRLAGAVGDPQRRGAQARDRGDVHDRAAAASESSGTAACVHRNGPVRLTASTRDHSSKRGLHQRLEDRDAGVVDQRVEPPEPRPPRDGGRDRPGRRRRRAAPASHRAGEPRPRRPAGRASMSSSATRQPSARNRLAVASPMPRAAPVTSATFCRAGAIGVPFASKMNLARLYPMPPAVSLACCVASGARWPRSAKASGKRKASQ